MVWEKVVWEWLLKKHSENYFRLAYANLQFNQIKNDIDSLISKIFWHVSLCFRIYWLYFICIFKKQKEICYYKKCHVICNFLSYSVSYCKVPLGCVTPFSLVNESARYTLLFHLIKILKLYMVLFLIFHSLIIIFYSWPWTYNACEMIWNHLIDVVLPM